MQFDVDKLCWACKETKSPDQFWRNQAACKTCGTAKAKAWAAANRALLANRRRDKRKANLEHHKDIVRRCLYGIEPEAYQTLRKKQNDLCAVCGEAEIGRALAIDHDHKTGKIRGLLCKGCNRGLGYFRDRSDLLDKAKEYLNAHASDGLAVCSKSSAA